MRTRAVIRNTALAAALAGSALLSVPAHAHEAGNTILRLGVAGAHLTDDLKTSLGSPPTPPYMEGRIKKNAFMAGLNATHMVTDHIGIDFLSAASSTSTRWNARIYLGSLLGLPSAI